MSTTVPYDDDDYFIDPPSRSPPYQPPTPVQKIRNGHKKKRSEVVVARKSKPKPPKPEPTSGSEAEDSCDEEEDVPHQWTTKQTRTLIQIRLSDEIDQKFRSTKKAHKHLWLVVAKKLQSLRIKVDHVQAQTKYAKLRREYTKRYTKVNKSGADRTPLFEWEFYNDLEPSFRSCRQIQPDSVECSESTPSDTPSASTLPREATNSGESSNASSSPASSNSLVFPNRRRKRPLTQDDRDELADKRFRTMVEHLAKIDEQYNKFNSIFERTSEAQTAFYKVQTEFAAAQLAVFRRDNDL
jgi:hypothetical protein